MPKYCSNQPKTALDGQESAQNGSKWLESAESGGRSGESDYSCAFGTQPNCESSDFKLFSWWKRDLISKTRKGPHRRLLLHDSEIYRAEAVDSCHYYWSVKARGSQEEYYEITLACNHSITMRTHRWPYGPCFNLNRFFYWYFMSAKYPIQKH